MRRASALWEVFMLRFEEALERYRKRRLPAAELTRMQILYQERYCDFTVKHFHEQLQKRHNYTLGYTVTRLALQGAGLVAKAKRRGTHRKKRERRPLPGMLLFQDGSTHRWTGGLDHDLDLVVTLDDATGAIYSAILGGEEGPCRASWVCSRRLPKKACFAPSIPTVDHTTSSRRKPGARSTNRSPPRSAGPWRSSASPTFHPIRPRRAAAWN